ncbi:hypothetical protein [Limosilactobacillus difficilis]|uniref:hypothetical protein n=1 Tax=Limosilactobacillus difficilis TaxID=2991838 RepID=UPI0024BAC023|nr:hypothetical protein [Limosilactobacillus difficilis]
MAQEKHHYIQPTGPRDAMELIQKLFNKYRNAELTSELLSYHQNLLMRLGDDILRAAQAEHNPQLMQDLKSMTAIMKSWLPVRMSGHPFPGKMKNFKLDAASPKHQIKRQVHKIHNISNHRSSRH